MIYEFLRKVPLFADLPEEDLERLCEVIQEIALTAGQELFSEGSPGDQAYVVKEGELEIIKNLNGRRVLLAVRKTGDVIGEMSLVEDVPRSATVRARTDSRLYVIEQEQFDDLVRTSPTASRVLLNTVLSRWKASSGAQRQSEKMAQLGVMAAGVAHELNNPAAAVKRGASQLKEVVDEYALARAEIARLELDEVQKTSLEELTQVSRYAAAQPSDYLDPLERSDRENELETWLEEHGVPDAWELAPILVNLDYGLADLGMLAATFNPDQLPAVVRWLGSAYSVYHLVVVIGQGANRISDIVKAMKSYTYLDQAPMQEVDVREGLDNTLLILRSKLNHIKVQREYDPGLPSIQAYGSELNQVWTNLLDNAADALEDTPGAQIIIRTVAEAGWVRVEIEDNGPGIPPEHLNRIFEPFFTTKPPGKGTGLGLDISYSIVINKHHGSLKVFSHPGRTVFRILLPEDFEAAEKNPQPFADTYQDDDVLMTDLLASAHTIAVVGISDRTNRPGYSIPAYLQAHGYRIIPVNPKLEQVLGEKVYPDLLSVPEKVDVVEIFRRGEAVLPVVEQAIQIGARAVWMQEGVVNEAAAHLARQAGLDVVMNVCMGATHRRLFKHKSA
jgi:signal transduction histidine kinase/predicted CoA-binding protein